MVSFFVMSSISTSLDSMFLSDSSCSHMVCELVVVDIRMTHYSKNPTNNATIGVVFRMLGNLVVPLDDLQDLLR